MLPITIPGQEYAVEDPDGTIRFIEVKEQRLVLEHSLISIQKWEAKWHKPFLDPFAKHTVEETRDYIRCMVVKPQDVDPNVFAYIPNSVINEVQAYMDDPMTGTTFTVHGKGKSPQSKKKISAEVLYWQMITLGIPFECRTWHLNQLLTLIHLCDIKGKPPKKMNRREQFNERNLLNKQRRAKHGSRG